MTDLANKNTDYDHVRDLEIQTEVTPNDAAAWIALGNAYKESGRPDDAYRAFSRAYFLSSNDQRNTARWQDTGFVS